jgi:hypothetical protein
MHIHTNTDKYMHYMRHIQEIPAHNFTYLHIPVRTDLHPSLSGGVFEGQLRQSQAAGALPPQIGCDGAWDTNDKRGAGTDRPTRTVEDRE